MEDILYTVSEVARLIKSNPAYTYSLINRLMLAIKLGSWKVRRTALLEFWRSMRNGLNQTTSSNSNEVS